MGTYEVEARLAPAFDVATPEQALDLAWFALGAGNSPDRVLDVLKKHEAPWSAPPGQPSSA